MSDASDEYIQRALAKIEGHLSEIAKIKVGVNLYCEMMDLPPRFSADELSGLNGLPVASLNMALKPDEFFNKPLAAAVRLILEKSKAASRGPMSVDDIHKILVQGGFNFSTNDVEGQKQGVRISLAKNSVTFSRLPNDLFGLLEWYGAKPRGRTRKLDIGLGDDNPVVEDTDEGKP